MQDTVQEKAKTTLPLTTVFKGSGLIGAQFTKLFYILTCAGESACSSKGFTQWLLSPDTFIHPYTWHWSWIQNPIGYWYIAAPYGYLWYGLNLPAVLGFLPWMFYLFLIDTFASYLVIRRQKWWFTVPWMLSSQFFLNYDGVDYFVFLFSSLGFINLLFPILALLVKLPLFAPDYVWQFIFHSPMSASNWINWGRYAWFGAWWLLGIMLYIQRRKRKLRLPTGLSHTT